METSSPSATVTMHDLHPDTTLASPSPATGTSGVRNLMTLSPVASWTGATVVQTPASILATPNPINEPLIPAGEHGNRPLKRSRSIAFSPQPPVAVERECATPPAKRQRRVKIPDDPTSEIRTFIRDPDDPNDVGCGGSGPIPYYKRNRALSDAMTNYSRWGHIPERLNDELEDFSWADGVDYTAVEKDPLQWEDKVSQPEPEWTAIANEGAAETEVQGSNDNMADRDAGENIEVDEELHTDYWYGGVTPAPSPELEAIEENEAPVDESAHLDCVSPGVSRTAYPTPTPSPSGMASTPLYMTEGTGGDVSGDGKKGKSDKLMSFSEKIDALEFDPRKDTHGVLLEILTFDEMEMILANPLGLVFDPVPAVVDEGRVSSDSLEEERSFKWEYVYEVSRKNTIRRGQLYTDEHPCPTKHNVPREIKPGVTVTSMNYFSHPSLQAENRLPSPPLEEGATDLPMHIVRADPHEDRMIADDRTQRVHVSFGNFLARQLGFHRRRTAREHALWVAHKRAVYHALLQAAGACTVCRESLRDDPDAERAERSRRHELKKAWREARPGRGVQARLPPVFPNGRYGADTRCNACRIAEDEEGIEHPEPWELEPVEWDDSDPMRWAPPEPAEPWMSEPVQANRAEEAKVQEPCTTLVVFRPHEHDEARCEESTQTPVATKKTYVDAEVDATSSVGIAVVSLPEGPYVDSCNLPFAAAASGYAGENHEDTEDVSGLLRASSQVETPTNDGIAFVPPFVEVHSLVNAPELDADAMEVDPPAQTTQAPTKVKAIEATPTAAPASAMAGPSDSPNNPFIERTPAADADTADVDTDSPVPSQRMRKSQLQSSSTKKQRAARRISTAQTPVAGSSKAGTSTVKSEEADEASVAPRRKTRVSLVKAEEEQAQATRRSPRVKAQQVRAQVEAVEPAPTPARSAKRGMRK